MRRRRGKLTQAANVVSDVLKEDRTNPAFPAGGAALRVFAAFERIGPPIVEHADPVLFRRGVLTLQVAESAWMTELSFLASKIRGRMNAILGRDLVKDVRFRLGPLERPPEPPNRARPVSNEKKTQIREWADQIRDEELRDAVIRAAERFAAHPKGPMPDICGPPGPRPTPKNIEPEPKTMSYGYGDKPKDRWKNKKPRW